MIFVTQTRLTSDHKRLLTLVSVGLMAALVFVGNYLQFKIPVAIGDVTRVHLGNSMCLLAGLLFGPAVGGLASGIGAALYDLFDPIYIISSPYTFCSKFAMGFIAGWLNKKLLQNGKAKTVNVVIAGVVGQIVYIVLYLFKSYVALRLVGSTHSVALAAVVPKIATSSVNAVAAVLISVPLFFALKKALAHTGFMALIEETPEKKGYFNPVTTVLTIYCCVLTLVFSLYLSTVNNIKAAEEERWNAVNSTLEEYEQRFDLLSEELQITFPEPEGTEASEAE